MFACFQILCESNESLAVEVFPGACLCKCTGCGARPVEVVAFLVPFNVIFAVVLKFGFNVGGTRE